MKRLLSLFIVTVMLMTIIISASSCVRLFNLMTFNVDLEGYVADISGATSIGIINETDENAVAMSRSGNGSEIIRNPFVIDASAKEEKKGRNYIFTEYENNDPEADETGITKVTFTKTIASVSGYEKGTKRVLAIDGKIWIAASDGFVYNIKNPSGEDIVVTDNDEVDEDKKSGIICVSGFENGILYEVEYAGVGKIITLHQEEINGEIERIYVMCDFTFICYVPEGLASKNWRTDVVGGTEFVTDRTHQSFVIDNRTGYVYSIPKELEIEEIRNNLLYVRAEDFKTYLYDMDVSSNSNLIFTPIITNPYVQIYNAFKDKYGNKYIENELRDGYDAETKTTYVTDASATVFPEYLTNKNELIFIDSKSKVFGDVYDVRWMSDERLEILNRVITEKPTNWEEAKQFVDDCRYFLDSEYYRLHYDEKTGEYSFNHSYPSFKEDEFDIFMNEWYNDCILSVLEKYEYKSHYINLGYADLDLDIYVFDENRNTVLIDESNVSDDGYLYFEDLQNYRYDNGVINLVFQRYDVKNDVFQVRDFRLIYECDDTEFRIMGDYFVFYVEENHNYTGSIYKIPIWGEGGSENSNIGFGNHDIIDIGNFKAVILKSGYGKESDIEVLGRDCYVDHLIPEGMTEQEYALELSSDKFLFSGATPLTYLTFYYGVEWDIWEKQFAGNVHYILQMNENGDVEIVESKFVTGTAKVHTLHPLNR